jgi:hypothetical protein
MSCADGHSFALTCRIAEGISVPQREQLLRSLARAVRERGLALLGSVGQDVSFVVVRAENDVRPADRRAIARWAFSRTELADYRVGPLRVSSTGEAVAEIA